MATISPYSSIRFFTPQTKDPGMILWPETQAGYASAILTESVWMNPYNIRVETMYPYKEYDSRLLRNLELFEEKTYVFFLENFYHSSIFYDRYVWNLFEKALSAFKDKEVILQSLKISERAALDFMRTFPFVKTVVRTDIERYFSEHAVNGIREADVANIVYRDEVWNPVVSRSESVNYPLSDCVFSAYSNGIAFREKESYHQIVWMLDEDDGTEDDKEYYKIGKRGFLRHLEQAQNEKKALITTGRGCRYKCSYCFRGAKYANVRQLPLETIRQDLDSLRKHGYESVYVYDDCFLTTNAGRLKEISELFASYGFGYQVAVRYEACNPESLELLKTMGVSSVQIGMQSSSAETNAKIGRGFRFNHLKSIIEKMKKNGMSVSVDVILWLPWETLADFVRTYNSALSLFPSNVTVNSLFLNPWTRLAEEVEKYGILTKETDEYNVPYIYESSTFSHSDILKAREYVKRTMDALTETTVTLR